MEFHEHFILEESDAEDTNFTKSESEEEELQVPDVLRTKRAEWCDSTTKYLIRLYKKHNESVGKAKTFSTYNKLWEFISEELNKKGIKFTPTQIKQKWDALVRSYKDNVTSNRQVGQKRKSCPFESELQEIFSKKRNVFPEFLASSKKEQTIGNPTTEEPQVEDHTSSIENNRKNFCRSPFRKFREMMEKQHAEKMSAIKQRNANLKKYHDEKLALLKSKEANRHEERMLVIEALKNKNN